MHYLGKYKNVQFGKMEKLCEDLIKILKENDEEFDEIEFCKWMAEKAIIAMVPRFIEIFKDGFPVTATQKVKVAALKEITDTTWDRAKAGLKFSARK